MSDGIAPPQNQSEWKQSSLQKGADAKEIAGKLANFVNEIKDGNTTLPPSFAKTLEGAGPTKSPQVCRKVDEDTAKSRRVLDCLEDTYRETGETLHRLTHQKHKISSELQVCRWRMNLRDKRPQQEHFNDHLQLALEAEKQALGECRVALREKCVDARRAMQKISILRQKLWKDSTVNRHLPGNVTQKNGPPATDPPPESTEDLPPPSPSAEGEGRAQAKAEAQQLAKDAKQLMDRLLQMDLNQLIAEGISLDSETKKIILAARETLKLRADEASAVKSKVNVSLTKRVAETSRLKKRIEDQLLQIHKVLEDADKQLVIMRRRLEFCPECPDEALKKREAEVADLRDKLLVANAALEQDHRSKVMAWRIDEACQKVTPDKACEKVEASNAARLVEVLTGTRPRRGLGRSQSESGFSKTA